ncbi:MAG: transglutaminase family protein [Pseudomarimonas sp.]
MTIQVALKHLTSYRYDRPIMIGPQVVRLRPAPHCRTRVISYSLRVEPEGHFVNWQQDPQANYLARLSFPKKADHLRIEVDLVVEMTVINPFDFFLDEAARSVPFVYDPDVEHELKPFLAKSPLTPELKRYLASLPQTAERTIDFLVEINRRLSQDIGYLIRLEPGVQTPEQTLSLRSGSCRDSAWLMVQLFRRLGIAARFASGYLIQLVADEKPLEGPSGPSEDFTDLHAWCEVYLPGAGWVGLDPTSGLFAGEGHIPLACTPDPGSAAPISGGLEACEVTFEHQMSVQRVLETRRVTKPYSPEQWLAIESLGHEIDEVLEQHDVRLTMGGEPTFVGIDDIEHPEWNTAALGPNKRDRAEALFWKMKDHYAPLGLAHFGQGKWYPGEQLPRWSLNCYWRSDGEALWRDPSLIVRGKRTRTQDGGDAAKFLAELATQLGVQSRHVFPAYEDLHYYLWRERKLPVNVDPSDSRLNDVMERERLARVYEQGLGAVVGYVLPLAHFDGDWQSSGWQLRSGGCFLIAGDSAMGYRLPLDSQPWLPKEDYPFIQPKDPFADAKPLPVLAQLPTVRGDASSSAAAASESKAEDKPLAAKEVVRTAICAEVRDGQLFIFLPPLEDLEHFLDLIHALECTAAKLHSPIVLEGYEPPRDERLQTFRVTPDPGVIEVNIHPAGGWGEMVERTTHLYGLARECRLSSEKFMLDGRHTGTGGGNHFVLGGARAADSPFLRRPDLLRSLIAYWHNHPSLSYLFSGTFIGPTSQAPRVDEARNDALYELEIAFSQIPDAGTEVSPWIVDRILRNLLVDVGGNTHRAEFCIDKLYSPDGPTGRLGLLELRGFEMPPHPQMSLAQQLLLRALIARFWRVPYAPKRLARWGSELHDRFMLPHFIERDFQDVLEETSAAGFALSPDWFAPHLEFRFPKIGDYALEGMLIELRHALEPWHVMGEEGASGGTARYVDSSLERVQVKVSGMPPDRYQVSCNGRALPLRPTGRVGEFVAGVRFRAWQPWSALHPLIPIDTPLRFDLFDTWNQRALGGCQYHVVHPGGLSYATFPVNAFEAETRRMSRFFRHGHTPGTFAVVPVQTSIEYPFTLDMRRR